jgi:hypothetical protein
MTVQSPPGPPPAAPPGAPPGARKGMGPLGWIAVGCGAIVIIGIICLAAATYVFKTKVVDPLKKNPTLAAAKLAVMANPDLEVVSEDDAANTITIHDRKSGKTVTWNASDIKNGKMSFTSDEGSVTINPNDKSGGVLKVTDNKGQETNVTLGAQAPSNLPSWLPTYPGAEVHGAFSSQGTEGSQATFTESTTDTADQVIAFYKDHLTAAGLDVKPGATASFGGTTSMASLTAESGDKKRQVSVLATTDQNQHKTAAQISYKILP